MDQELRASLRVVARMVRLYVEDREGIIDGKAMSTPDDALVLLEKYGFVEFLPKFGRAVAQWTVAGETLLREP